MAICTSDLSQNSDFTQAMVILSLDFSFYFLNSSNILDINSLPIFSPLKTSFRCVTGWLDLQSAKHGNFLEVEKATEYGHKRIMKTQWILMQIVFQGSIGVLSRVFATPEPR